MLIWLGLALVALGIWMHAGRLGRNILTAFGIIGGLAALAVGLFLAACVMVVTLGLGIFMLLKCLGIILIAFLIGCAVRAVFR